MSKIKLNSIEVSKNRILYDYSVSDDITKYFNLQQPFFIEYDEDISMVPEAILVVPFLTNILPIAWITDSEVVVDSVDRVFFESIPKFKKGYADMYPHVVFAGRLKATTIVDCCYAPSGRTAVFFSGGLDSYCALIRNLEQKPVLMTLWGADVRLDDVEGWNTVKNAVVETADIFGLGSCFIKSSFTLFLNNAALNNDFGYISPRGWWGAIQHGIGIIGHAAPYAWKHRLSVQYIAASFCDNDQNVHCASYPTIDGKVAFGSCLINHDSFDYSRQDKIKAVTDFSNKTAMPINLRVCWESAGGKNCCKCEKCYRTIMGILVSGNNPRNYNFDIKLNATDLGEIESYLVWHCGKGVSLEFLWGPIKNTAIQNKAMLREKEYFRYIKWIYSIDLSDIEHHPIRKKYETTTKLKLFILKFVPQSIYKKYKHK